jgi:hypothetical protein
VHGGDRAFRWNKQRQSFAKEKGPALTRPHSHNDGEAEIYQNL